MPLPAPTYIAAAALGRHVGFLLILPLLFLILVFMPCGVGHEERRHGREQAG